MAKAAVKARPIRFSLGAAFTIIDASPAVRFVQGRLRNSKYRAYEYTPAQGTGGSLRIRYAATLAPLDAPDATFERGTVSEAGAYLGPSSGWYPDVADQPFTFALRATAPAGWSVISQGAAAGANQWHADAIARELYLIAGRYTTYTLDDGKTPRIEAYLLTPDRDLATRYNKRARQYVATYQTLLGPYPYTKFALIENFWQSGLGMPSFTLLGSRVLRLPFILDSSFPHEIVHNWWGNGVYVDYATGNWAEGLTAYVADHAIKQQAGKGVRYRRAALQKYRNYVDTDLDFPLSAFRGGHSASDQAVGYNKALMVFHMLRRTLGDANFSQGLRLFYASHRFKRASYNDLQRSMSAIAGRDLGPFFEQWVSRTGAPALSIGDVSVAPDSNGRFLVQVRVDQTQPLPPFTLDVPVVVDLGGNGQRRTVEHTLRMSTRSATWHATLDESPRAVRIDPRFDLFRQLAEQEIPPSLGEIFGAKAITIVLPRAGDAQSLQAYQTLAQAWRQRYGATVTDDHSALRAGGALEHGTTLWLLGEHNALLATKMPALREHLLPTQPGAPVQYLTLEGKQFSLAQHSIAVVMRTKGATVGWLSVPRAEDLPIIARKLPHYGRYSYAVFASESAQIQTRGEWPVARSPLTKTLHPGHTLVPLAPQTALIEPVR
ncbi:MAG: aminopeptidase N [Gammaproteobacteria bacterium]|jgi:aminopeptidase N